MDDNSIIKKFGQRLNYSDSEVKLLEEGGHRIRHLKRLAKAAPLYSIEAEVVKSRHCNSGHETGQKFILDVGVECLGFGEVMMKVNVVPRSKLP